MFAVFIFLIIKIMYYCVSGVPATLSEIENIVSEFPETMPEIENIVSEPSERGNKKSRPVKKTVGGYIYIEILFLN